MVDAAAAAAAAECDPTERQGSSIWEGCDKFQLVPCSQSVLSYG